MKKIKLFVTTASSIISTQNEIDEWIIDNNINVISVSQSSAHGGIGVQTFITIIYNIN